jgi:hypothetical protein
MGAGRVEEAGLGFGRRKKGEFESWGGKREKKWDQGDDTALHCGTDQGRGHALVVVGWQTAFSLYGPIIRVKCIRGPSTYKRMLLKSINFEIAFMSP